MIWFFSILFLVVKYSLNAHLKPVVTMASVIVIVVFRCCCCWRLDVNCCCYCRSLCCSQLLIFSSYSQYRVAIFYIWHKEGLNNFQMLQNMSHQRKITIMLWKQGGVIQTFSTQVLKSQFIKTLIHIWFKFVKNYSRDIEWTHMGFKAVYR